jgi:hypothetical protein
VAPATPREPRTQRAPARNFLGAALAAAAVTAASACDRRPPPLASCDDDLRGVYVADDGRRWMILDARDTLEGYPLFDDVTHTSPRPASIPRGSAPPHGHSP